MPRHLPLTLVRTTERVPSLRNAEVARPVVARVLGLQPATAVVVECHLAAMQDRVDLEAVGPVLLGSAELVPLTPVLGVLPVPSEGLLTFYDFTRLVALGVGGVAWRTPSPSWDGLEEVRAIGGVI